MNEKGVQTGNSGQSWLKMFKFRLKETNLNFFPFKLMIFENLAENNTVLKFAGIFLCCSVKHTLKDKSFIK